MASPENIKISHSAEMDTRLSVERYLEDLREDVREEIERITNEETMLGEGRAAEVFIVKQMRRSRCDACIKVWRPGLEKLKGQNFIEYAKIQTLEPEEEFKLQDDLYISGFTHIPRPFAYTEIKGMRAMAMEQIHGYTLKELQDAGVSIAEPGWQELEYMLIEINKKYGIVHRDLHTGNIMLETDDDISKQKTVSGTLKFIDLGLAKQTYGSFSPEDFQLTIGDHIVRFPGDRDQIEKLKPNRRSSYNVFTH